MKLNEGDWRIPTAGHNRTYAIALADAERDSQLNAATRNDVYARAVADADKKLQTWTQAVDVWYMGEVNDAEKSKQYDLATAESDWRDALYQANVDAWTAVDADLALPWTGFKKDEAEAQEAAWQDRRGSVVGTTIDSTSGYRLKWLEMQSQVINSEHAYQNQLIAAYDTMITSSGIIDAQHAEAYASSLAIKNNAIAAANDFHQFATDVSAAEKVWQIGTANETFDNAGGPDHQGFQADLDSAYRTDVEGFQATLQDNMDSADRGRISGPGSVAVSGVGDQSEAQRVCANAVNSARNGRDNAQQLAQTVYEAGYIEKLDSLYSDTSGFLGATATPWHHHRQAVTSAEAARFVGTSVTVPSDLIETTEMTSAALGGEALMSLAYEATANYEDQVYNNSVDDARKDLADDRAQDSLDEALADFDQEIADRELDPVTVELPGQLEYQQRDDEPTAPTYDLYQEGTIWGDQDWHDQGFDPAAPSDFDGEEPPADNYYELGTLQGARDEYGDLDFTVEPAYTDDTPDHTYRNRSYVSQLPGGVLGEARDQDSWNRGNVPSTSP